MIAPDLKIKDIEPDTLINLHIKDMVKNLLDDYDQKTTQEQFDHTYNRLTFFLKRRYKLLAWCEVEFIFNAMSEGTYTLKRVSVNNILDKFHEYVKAKIEKNRIELEKKEQKIVTEWADLNQTPYGQAVLYKIMLKEKGQTTELTLLEIAERIKSGEIKYKYQSAKRGRRFIDPDIIMEVISQYKTV